MPNILTYASLPPTWAPNDAVRTDSGPGASNTARAQAQPRSDRAVPRAFGLQADARCNQTHVPSSPKALAALRAPFAKALPTAPTREARIGAYLAAPHVCAPPLAATWVAHGQAVLQDLNADFALHRLDLTPRHPVFFRLDKADLYALFWSWMAEAAAQGDGFTDGALTVWHPQIHHIAELMADAQGSYPRVSSHLKVLSAQRCFGIDFPADEGFAPLPGGTRRHLLIIDVAQSPLGPFMLLKPETYGLASHQDMAQHGVHFGLSLGRKVAPRLFGSNDDGGKRKERLPKETLVQFKKATSGMPLQKEALAQIGSHGDGFGICAMMEYVAVCVAQRWVTDQAQMASLEAFVAQLTATYRDVKRRFGNEVILDLPQQ